MNKKNEKVMRIFKNFDINEVLVLCSDKEIIDCINLHYIDSLVVLLKVLQDFRDYVNTPIRITSGFRGIAHNLLVGGSTTSQHKIGQAIDFQPVTMPFQTFKTYFREWVASAPCRDLLGQIIIYPNFIHLALRCKSHKKLTIYEKRKC